MNIDDSNGFSIWKLDNTIFISRLFIQNLQVISDAILVTKLFVKFGFLISFLNTKIMKSERCVLFSSFFPCDILSLAYTSSYDRLRLCSRTTPTRNVSLVQLSYDCESLRTVSSSMWEVVKTNMVTRYTIKSISRQLWVKQSDRNIFLNKIIQNYNFGLTILEASIIYWMSSWMSSFIITDKLFDILKQDKWYLASRGLRG